MYINLTKVIFIINVLLIIKIGCVLPNIHYCPAGFLANITKGKKLGKIFENN